MVNIPDKLICRSIHQIYTFNFYQRFQMKNSKLLTQLRKEKKKTPQIDIDEERIQDIFNVLAKMEPKNLMMVELLIFVIEKGFIKNSYKIYTIMDIYETIKNEGQKAINANQVTNEEEDKFGKQKFTLFLKQIAYHIYPGTPLAYEKIVYKKIATVDDDQRLKIEDVVKKFLTKETLNKFRQYNSQLETVFQIYIPQNFNHKMGFKWQQIRFLEKKIPILSAFRFLWQIELVPHYISPTQYLEMVSKIIPPMNSNHKEVMFYYSQTINHYIRDSVNSKTMKVLDGDIGLTFFEFQIVLTRVSIEFAKETKNDSALCLEKLFKFMKLREIITHKGQAKSKQNKFQEHVQMFFENHKAEKKNLQTKKRETKKKIQALLSNENFNQEQTKNMFLDNQTTRSQLYAVKKSLDEEQLPFIPIKPETQKENDPSYNIEMKHIVIGQQLPKMQVCIQCRPDKNKSTGMKKPDKRDELMNKYKFQEKVNIDQSSDHYAEMIRKHKKVRTCHDFPIILTVTVYPNNLPNVSINPKAEIYLQTTYIHLGQKQYENAFINFLKAKILCQPRPPQTEFYFELLEAQIYESAGKDGISLLHYHKAKQIASSLKDERLLSYAFRGIGGCLYHMQEYEYALRCYLKIQEVEKKDSEASLGNGLTENNIGCCLMMLGRHTEAHQHFKFSEGIFDLVFSKLNEKTLVVQQNASKNKKACIELEPQFKTMWRTYEEKLAKPQANPKASKGKKT